DVDTTEVVPYLPSLVGQPGPTIVLGKGSGVDNIAEGLERLGLQASDEQKLEMLGQVKAKSLEKRDLLDDEEFATIAEDVLGTRA
nr:pyruvate carboxyltransferase [Nocardioidaceae bacterium]